MIFRNGAQQIGSGGGIVERKEIIDRKHKPPLSRQAKALGISRGSVYYKPRVGR